jgi:hypothetical protein
MKDIEAGRLSSQAHGHRPRCLDDFGTGFASHSEDVQLAYLKIDVDFVRNLTGDTSISISSERSRGWPRTSIAEGVRTLGPWPRSSITVSTSPRASTSAARRAPAPKKLSVSAGGWFQWLQAEQAYDAYFPPLGGRFRAHPSRRSARCGGLTSGHHHADRRASARVATVRIRQNGEERTIAVCGEHLRGSRVRAAGGAIALRRPEQPLRQFFSDFFGDSPLGGRTAATASA